MNRFDMRPIFYILLFVLLLAMIGLAIVQPFRLTNSTEPSETTNPTETTTPEQETVKEKIETIATIMTTAATEPDIPETTETTETTETEPPATEPEPTESTMAPTEPVLTTEPNSGMTELEMLALVIFQEVGGDSYCDDCRRRVVDVVLNRVAHEAFPDTIYEVLTQKAQYGRLYWTGLVWPEWASSPYEKHAVERAYKIAEEVLNGQHSTLYGNGYIWQAEFVQGKDNIYCCGHYFGR